MRLPALFRTTPFRLTLLFVGLFAGASTALFIYLYAVTAGEVTRTADAGVAREMKSLELVYNTGGLPALKSALGDRVDRGQFIYVLVDASGHRLFGAVDPSPLKAFDGHDTSWVYVKLIGQGQSEGILEPGEPERVGLVLFATIQGIAALVTGGIVEADQVDELVADAIARFLRGSRTVA